MTTLLIIIILYFALRLSAKYLFPFLVKRYLNKIKKRFEEQQNPGSTSQQSSNKVKIKYPSREKNRSDFDLEYTDYEEVVDRNENSTTNTYNQ